MKYNAEQITYMLAEAIDQNREYKSWHCSTQHLMALVERVVAEEREACAKVCESYTDKSDSDHETHGYTCAIAIRARDKQDGECKHCTDGCPACDARKLPEQEPASWRAKNFYENQEGWFYAEWYPDGLTPQVAELLYTTPPQRTWVGLTDKEIEEIWKIAMFADYGIGAELSNQPFVHYARAIEAKLKEKNT